MYIMPTINDAFHRACQLNNEIQTFLNYVGYFDSNDLSELQINRKDPDELLLLHKMSQAASSLCDVFVDISYLQRTIVGTGVLHLNENGRYERDDGFEYTCGDSIEFLHKADDYRDYAYWACSSVEASNGKYYIVHNSTVDMEGLTVRIRASN